VLSVAYVVYRRSANQSMAARGPTDG
jgi:hypothetical protein